MNKISIIGCGWLGLPLAIAFLKKGFDVKGSTTSAEKLAGLQNQGIEPYLIRLEPNFVGDLRFFDSEILIINVPPRAKAMGEEFHLQQISFLLSEASKSNVLKKILFVSSTSVYPNIEKEMKEEDAIPDHYLVKAEKLVSDFCTKNKKQFLIIRFGGLMGFDRNACKYFTPSTAHDYSKVNYIHQLDAVGAIVCVVGEDNWGQVFNIVSPKHPSRAEIYAKCLEGLVKETYESGRSSIKVINTDNFFTKSKYQFQFLDPLDFRYL